jgi:oligosaccharide repeat unit polymerase
VLLWDTTASPNKSSYLHALIAALLVFPIGVWSALPRPAGRIPARAATAPRSRAFPSDRHLTAHWRLLLIASIVIVCLFFLLSSHVQFIDLLRGIPTSDNDRFSQAELPKELQFFFEIARRVFLPVCAVFAYFMSCIEPAKWRMTFWLTFGFAFFVSVLTLDRSPPLGLLGMLAVAFFLQHRGNARALIGVALLLVGSLLLAGVISIFQYQNDRFSLGQAFDTAWYVATMRLFESPFIMATRAFDAYNYDTRFLYGADIRLFSILPGFHYVESATDWSDPLAVAPVTFIGDLWRNWGWPGILIGAFGFGYMFQRIQNQLAGESTAARATMLTLLLLGALGILHGKALGVVTMGIIVCGWLMCLFINQVVDRFDASPANRLFPFPARGRNPLPTHL